MQRVVSLQTGRNFTEPASDFVTKRLCMSFLFAVGLMCLLAGFMLGGQAADWSNRMREQKAMRELADNGMQPTRKHQGLMLDKLNASTFHPNFEDDEDVKTLRRQEITRNRDIFADLSIFKLNVEEGKKTTVATICGTEEPDRYIVLSASGEGFDIAVKIARTLDYIHRHEGWEPKRTLIFCVFFDSTDHCSKKFLDRIKPKIVSYIAIHGNAATGDQIGVSGSAMVQSTIFNSIEQTQVYHENTFNGIHLENTLPRLNLDVPHATISFVESSSSKQNTTKAIVERNQKILAQIVGLSVWTLSEEIFFRWEPKYFSGIVDQALTTITSEGLRESRDSLNHTLAELIDRVTNLNSNLNKMDIFKSLPVRMVNDRMLDLDRALLCSRDTPTNEIMSRTDFTKFKMLPFVNVDEAKRDLQEMSDCYAAASSILLERAFCTKVLTDAD
ncbi:hypothetical protein QAD02_004754 [Eretmocerus hayati]|uniref:Uncharacterized protein n=1 Tax=Eretmocerus hayati TaxID=131215 RepID=A0ACC2NQU5_9HYME|nr:hypothetical protein QAD02_004754 [Eretmocerus hayati]